MIPPRPRQLTRSRLARAVIRLALVSGVGLSSITCDAADVLGPPSVEDVVVEYLGDTTIVVGSATQALVRARLGGDDLADARLGLSSSDTSIVAVRSGDSLVARRRGVATITASLQSSMLPRSAPAATARIHVVARDIFLDRTNVVLASLGDTVRLVATATDAEDAPIADIHPDWRTSDSSVATVNAQGRVRALGNGTASVLAILDGDTALATVRVQQQVSRIVLEPAALLLDAIGADSGIVATPRDANDSLVTAATPLWTSDDAGIASVDQAGRITARRNGVTYVHAWTGAQSDSLRVEVNQRAVLVVISSTNGLTIPALGVDLQLSARAFDRENRDVVDDTTSWYTLDPDTAIVEPNTGLVRGLLGGSTRIVAAMDGAEDTVLVRVVNDPASIEVLPASATLASVNDTVPLRATVRNQRGDVLAGAAVSWHSADSATVRVTTDGRAIAAAKGSARIVGSVPGFALADTVLVDVTNAPASIAIGPDSVRLEWVGAVSSPAAVIRNARGDTLPRTSVSWQSANAAVATVSAAGEVTARGVGTTYVRAVSGAIADSLRVVVTDILASVAIPGPAEDSLTAVGQTLALSAVVRDQGGNVVPNAPISWSTLNGAIVGVTANGVASAAGFGTTSLIARSGNAADTITIVVQNRTLLRVSNAASASGVGTLARPFRRIADALAIADAGDTVLVAATGTPYAESVRLERRLTMLGDSTAYVANGRAPDRLPAIAHDTGAAAIVIATPSAVTVKYLTIRHAVDGPAIEARNADVVIEHVHVNPGASLPAGSGISVLDAPAFAVVANATVTAVRGYGVRLENVVGGRVSAVRVENVSALAGASGAGIEVRRGSGSVIEANTVRGTAGPQIQVDSAAATRLEGNSLAGRHQLARLLGATGATSVTGNVFDLTLQPGEPFSVGSAADGRSGLAISLSAPVSVVGNTFVETGTRAMDAIRLTDARGGAPGSVLQRNTMLGGRYQVRSARSTWQMLATRADGAERPVVLEDADTVALSGDTLANAAGSVCLEATGANSALTVNGVLFADCTASGSATGQPAIRMSGAGTRLIMTGATFTGPNQTAIDFSGAELRVRGSRVDGRGIRSVSSFATSAAVRGVAGVAEIANNVVLSFDGIAGVELDAPDIRVDSNRITRTDVALRALDFNSGQFVGNDISGNDTGVVNLTNNRDLGTAGTWWGDARGPRRSGVPAATGDSTVGRVLLGTFATVPYAAGSGATSVYIVRGNGQTAPRNTLLPKAFTVRVVDAELRPVAGVVVTFTVTSGGGRFGVSNSATATTDASGLAEATLTLGLFSGQTTVSVTAPGLNTVTFVATGT